MLSCEHTHCDVKFELSGFGHTGTYWSNDTNGDSTLQAAPETGTGFSPNLQTGLQSCNQVE